ncbi:MAG: hypothetical protein LBT04_04870, partial [Prevotellaceae bacterium]|nr:hypothetical protein [Prevotellaceae bacterium]
MAALFAMYGVAQTAYTVPFTEDFEGSSVSTYWTLASSSANHWMIGAGIGNPGNSLYITSDGSSSGYSAATTYASAYMNVDFGNYLECTLSFDWAIMGEEGTTFNYDRVQVFSVPSDMPLPSWTATYISSSSPDVPWISGANVYYLGTFIGQATWQHSSLLLPNYVSGSTTRKIVFLFWCDSSLNYPPVAVDNVSVTGSSCARPSAVTVPGSTIAQTTADISWTGTAE